MLRKLILGASVLCAVASLHAKDYGVQGTVYPIVERDIREMLIESAARTDWSAVNKELRESAKNVLSRLPKRFLPVAESTHTTWLDPSITLTEDIHAPVQQPDGSYAWQVLFPKGTKVNPLEHNRPATAFLLFDGSDERQLAWVKEVLAREPDRLIPVEAGAGDVGEDNKFLGRTVFHASDAMIGRFQVRYLPSMVYPGTGTHRLYLGVTAFAAPFSVAEALMAWSELGFKKPDVRGAR